MAIRVKDLRGEPAEEASANSGSDETPANDQATTDHETPTDDAPSDEPSAAEEPLADKSSGDEQGPTMAGPYAGDEPLAELLTIGIPVAAAQDPTPVGESLSFEQTRASRFLDHLAIPFFRWRRGFVMVFSLCVLGFLAYHAVLGSLLPLLTEATDDQIVENVRVEPLEE